MKNTYSNPLSKYDYFFLLVLVLLNPLIYSFNITASGLMPDSPAYILLGNNIIENGYLFLEGWGHIDTGLILPPLYPFLIGIFQLLSDDGIYNAQLISMLSLLLSTFPLYLFVRRLEGSFVAFIAAMIFHLNFFYIYYGTSVLTEGLFLLVLLTLLFLTCRLLDSSNNRYHLPISIGILTALLFFTRQIGIFFLAVLPFLIIYNRIRNEASTWGQLTAFFLGFLLLFIPYNAILYYQSGNHSLTQYYRIGNYTIEADTKHINSQQLEKSYLEKYQQRRNERQLNHAGNEMIGKLVFSQNDSPKLSIRLDSYHQNILNNIKNIIKNHGLSIFFASAIALFSGLFFSWKYKHIKRSIIPITIIAYILILSLVSTGKVDRYTDILFVLLSTSILTEFSAILKQLFKKNEKALSQNLLFILLSLIVVFITPKLFTATKSFPRLSEKNTPINHCKSLISANEPIFSINSMGPYLLGGIYRTLPNDSLEKIAIYAQHTNTKWLFIRKSELDTNESLYYKNAPWLTSIHPIQEINPDFSLKCASSYGDAYLYFISN